MSNERVNFNELVEKMKNSSPIRKDEDDYTPIQKRGEEGVSTEPKKKGRPKKETVLDLNIGINVFFDNNFISFCYFF